MKTCEYCGAEYEPAFNKPHQQYCSHECGVKAWRDAHPGCIARWAKSQRESYPERTRAATNRYASTHREGAKERAHRSYENNKDAVNARARKWAKDHPEKARASMIAWQTAHKEYPHQYWQSHVVEGRAHAATRRAFIIGSTMGNLAEVKEIYRRAKEDKRVRCYLCGKLIPMDHRHVDHIIPLSKGGAHRPSNLAVACDKCNMSKGAKLPEVIGLLI